MYEIGQKVRVSNGQPRPPERFNRKLRAWKSDNFDGVIERIEEPRSYQPKGALVIDRSDVSVAGIMKFSVHVPIGGYLKIEVIQ